jgi:AraC-like DNA-binding protein
MDAADPRWRVVAFEAQQTVRRDDCWRWRNRERPANGHAVIQETRAGASRIGGPAVADGPVLAPAGHALLFVYGEDSSYEQAPEAGDYRCRYIILNGAGVADHVAWLQARHGHAPRLGAAALAASDRLYDDLERQGTTTPRHILDLLLAIDAELSAAGPRGQRPVDAAVEALLVQPFTAVDLKGLAARHGCTREHLVRRFTARTGLPPGRWLAERRLERALALVQHGDRSAAAIAAQCGLSLQALGRLLRSRTGRGVQAWREITDR